MQLLTTTLAALVPLAAAVPAQTLSSRSKPDIEWSKCKIGGTLPGECGKMMAPLDYTDDDSEDTLIQMVRVSAPKKPKKGSIFLNFGGPGASGIEDLAAFSENLLA